MGSTRGTVWLFDTQSKELLTFENLIGELVTELAYSPSGQQLVLGSNGLVGVWNMQSDEPVLELDGANDVTTSVAYSPCGQWIAASSCDHMVRLWHREVSEEVESWPYVAVLRGFFDKVGSLSWNPATPTDFVTVSHDDSFRVWRVSKDDGGDVAVTMVWGSNPGVLCVTNMLLKDTTGLSPVNQRLLMQREAVEDPINELEMKFVSNGWS
ncbi:hypothetical protein BGX24_011678 [Mortierella sp. AD032]|nr:hypothetical protein BGX24_011678 [Mortierella sp. AD032]